MASDPRRSLESILDFSSEQITAETEEETSRDVQGHTGTTHISSRYKNITSKSNLIHSGPLSVYQLRPKKAKFYSFTKMTVGEKNPNKTNRIILLVGETGAGKSTLTNALLNYSMGVKWEDKVWFQIVEEERSESESQTSDVIVYEIFGFEDKTLPYSLTIIDTPGFGNTKGTGHDDIVSNKLMDLFQSEDGVREVHAVGLVMKAAGNRLSDRLNYIFDSVMSLFGKNMEKNIIALITHSDGVKPKNVLEVLEIANIKCAKNEKNELAHFLVDNRQNTLRTEENKCVLEAAWRVTERGMSQFTAFLERSTPQNLKKTVEVLVERITLKACIQEKIKKIQEALKKHEEEMKQNFPGEVDEDYKVKQIVDSGMWGLFFFSGAVCCTVCEENCHHPGCTKAWNPEHCEIMKGGLCTVCTNKCPASDHVKEKWIYVTKTRRVKKTVQEIKEKYKENKSEFQNQLSLLEKLEEEMKELKANKSQFLDESYQHVVRLEQIALKADSASTIVHLDFLIEKMKEEGDTEKVQKLEEMSSRVDEGTKAALGYKFGKL